MPLENISLYFNGLKVSGRALVSSSTITNKSKWCPEDGVGVAVQVVAGIGVDESLNRLL